MMSWVLVPRRRPCKQHCHICRRRWSDAPFTSNLRVHCSFASCRLAALLCCAWVVPVRLVRTRGNRLQSCMQIHSSWKWSFSIQRSGFHALMLLHTPCKVSATKLQLRCCKPRGCFLLAQATLWLPALSWCCRRACELNSHSLSGRNLRTHTSSKYAQVCQRAAYCSQPRSALTRTGHAARRLGSRWQISAS